jgi:hypothetical protein
MQKIYLGAQLWNDKEEITVEEEAEIDAEIEEKRLEEEAKKKAIEEKNKPPVPEKTEEEERLAQFLTEPKPEPEPEPEPKPKTYTNPTALQAMHNAFVRNKRLTKYDFKNTKISDDGIYRIIQALGVASHVTEVEIGHWMEGETREAFEEAIKKNKPGKKKKGKKK